MQYGNVCVSLQLLSLAFIMNKFIIFLAQARSQDNRMDISYARHHEARGVIHKTSIYSCLTTISLTGTVSD